ncbi:MAG: DUF4340 domain-containing protein [Phycisphaerae bacterium]|nr:DUF4340 domain-containing protein [Phycisphaerae bacterium]
MNTKKLTILAVVAFVMVIWAAVQSGRARRPRPTAGVPTYLIQGLDPAGIGTITIGTGDKQIRLQRRGKGFEVANKDNYPADLAQVNELITQCMDIQTTHLASSNPANHADLGVTEDKAQTVIRFHKFVDGNEVLMTGVLVGEAREGGQGAYVRLVNRDEVYLAPSTPWFRESALEYVDQELLSIQTGDLESVTVIAPAGRYVLQKKEGTESFEMPSLPEGKRLKESDARSVATAVSSLRFDDVKKGPDTTLDFNRQYMAKLKDSTLYTLRIAQKDGKTYATCHAEFTDPNKVVMDPKKVDSPEELKKKEARLLAEEKALKFAARHTAWVYEIPSWKAGYLTKDVNDLVEDLPKPAAGTEAKEPNAVSPAALPAQAPTPITSVPEPNVPAPAGTAAIEPNKP